MADVSDSVLIQAEQIAEASGVQLALDQSLISHASEFAELSSLADELKVDVFQWILAGGEDHVLLATGVNLPGIRIGSVRAGAGVSGVEMKKAPVSWSHFQ
jgi:thiamine-monophosphate kinase